MRKHHILLKVYVTLAQVSDLLTAVFQFLTILFLVGNLQRCRVHLSHSMEDEIEALRD